MLFKVIDRQGNCLMSTDMEKLARRFVEDNPERGYSLRPVLRQSQQQKIP